MQHPLENPSLTPVGFTFSGGATRLQHGTSPGYINHDLVSAEFWSNANSLKASLPRPAETIIHELMPSIATIGRTTKGDFEFAGRPYLSRDIMILSRFVQWFGSNCGRSFLFYSDNHVPEGTPAEKVFLFKLMDENTKSNTTRYLIHECSESCKRSWGWFGECVPDSDYVTRRDEIVVEALMRWLGKKAGQEYISRFKEHFTVLNESVRREAIKKYTEEQIRL